MRADGLLVPVAVFENGTWTAACPEPSNAPKFDRMIASMPSYWGRRQMPVPKVWHAVRAGTTPERISVLTPVIFDEHCAQQVGLLTDMPSRKPDVHEKRLAMDRLLPTDRPVDVLASDEARDGWRDLIETAEREISRQEATAIANWEQELGGTSLLEPPDRRPAIRLTALNAYRAEGVRLLYYEAERRYAKAIWKEGVEPSVLAVAGWIQQQTGAEPRAVEGRAVITDGDFKEAIHMTPLGIVHASTTASFWVTEAHGYEHEELRIYRILPGGLELAFTAFVGGC